MKMSNLGVLNHLWQNFLTSNGFGTEEVAKSFSTPARRSRSKQKENSLLANFLKERSFSMSRFYEKVSMALWDIYVEGGEYARLIDVYLNDDGAGLSAIVAQGGKLFQVPLSVANEDVTMGDWVQVEEKFVPVTQSRFLVRRQKDGRYRWTAIAGTSILNRAGEIDSVKLFDSFVTQAQEEGVYPRLDFYHHGEEDPELWEFGTADYLAREGVCYIASGLFDEDHPLAKATIRAAEGNEHEWGCSIEFYAYAEPEKIIVDPEVTIPVYNDGLNTRISVVKEREAAALFTRIGVTGEGVKRAMDQRTKEALTDLYGGGEGLEEFLASFENGVDQTNQRVRDERLIHRTTTQTEVEEEVPVDEEEDEEEAPEMILDDAAVAAISQAVFESPTFKALAKGVESLATARAADQAEIESLKKTNGQLAKAIERLAKDDGQRKTEYLQDLPARKRQVVTYRASEAHNEPEEDDDPFVFASLETSEDIASRTLSKLPSY